MDTVLITIYNKFLHKASLRCDMEIIELNATPVTTDSKHTGYMCGVLYRGNLTSIQQALNCSSLEMQLDVMPPLFYLYLTGGEDSGWLLILRAQQRPPPMRIYTENTSTRIKGFVIFEDI